MSYNGRIDCYSLQGIFIKETKKAWGMVLFRREQDDLDLEKVQ